MRCRLRHSSDIDCANVSHGLPKSLAHPDGLAVPDDTSIAQMVADAAPASTHVVKAFNTLFRDVLAAGGPLDVFMAGDDAQAKASLSAFITNLGLRPRDTARLARRTPAARRFASYSRTTLW